MKILILGSNSFLAKEIKNFFINKNISFVSRTELNLEDTSKVDLFFNNNFFDVVINTCTLGGKRGVVDDFNVLTSNLLMFNNILRNKSKYGYLFTFCSGAAFDRKKDIKNVQESDLIKHFPEDYYGLSKNLISREVIQHKNIFNFRIFGCFGKHELETRFIKNSLNRLKEKKDIIIQKDKYMDYISAEDVCKILEFYIDNIDNNNYKDINLVYKDKIKLSDIAKKIIDLKNSNQSIIIEQEGLDKSYTGDGSKLSCLPVKISGFDNSLLRIIYD